MNPALGHTPLFFDGWYNVGRAAALSLLGFVALIAILRLSGKRTLSKLNVFDFVFVVAVGSIFGGSIIEKDVTLLEGLAAVTTLVVFQAVLAELAARSDSFEQLINGEPALLLSRGQFLRRTMKKERITEEEVRAAIRQQGVSRIEDVDAVVLENDGTLTVAWTEKKPGESSLVDAKPHEREKTQRPRSDD
jgi:uncharacterized membrane protein YcaP (DUF421 family)